MTESERERFRAAVFQQAGLPMAVLDTQGCILDWNWAAERVLGYSRRQAVGQSALLVRQPEDARKLELLLKRTVRERRLADFETQVTRSDGSEIPVAMSVCPLADALGKVTAVGVVLRDRTRQKALERHLAEEEKLAAIGRLAGGMSHHINNILAAVSARVEMALATRDAQASQQALRLTGESIDRLSNLTRNLLLFSGAEHSHVGACRPEVIARRVVQRFRNELVGDAVRLEADIGEVPAAQLDAQDFQQVLENLLLNARQAVAESGTITVRLAAEGTGVALTVEDSGHGIAEDDLPHVFEPFWTTRGSLAGGTGGALGLGLTVAHGLVTAAGGSLALDSLPGRGTTVTAALPVARPPAGRPPTGHAVPETRRL